MRGGHQALDRAEGGDERLERAEAVQDAREEEVGEEGQDKGGDALGEVAHHLAELQALADEDEEDVVGACCCMEKSSLLEYCWHVFPTSQRFVFFASSFGALLPFSRLLCQRSLLLHSQSPKRKKNANQGKIL